MPSTADPTGQDQALRCTLSAEPRAVRDGLACLVAAPPVSVLPPLARASVELALAEVLNNITEHAYAGTPGLILVTVLRTGVGLHCEIVDSGLAMPGGTQPEGAIPDLTTLPLADLPEGGFGWGLIRSLTRDLHYVRADGENRLTFLIPV